VAFDFASTSHVSADTVQQGQIDDGWGEIEIFKKLILREIELQQTQFE
jgi:hypothetical protein